MNFSRRKLIKYLISIGAISSASALVYSKFRPTEINSSSSPHLVIIGLGAYGIALSNYLRRFVDNLKITVIDNNPTYVDRFSQSDYLARGVVVSKTKPKEAMLNLDYKAENQFSWFDDEVIATDATNNRIQTRKNGIIRYDALVVATGVSNLKNNLLDLNQEKVGSFYFDHQSNQKAFAGIRDAIRSDGKVLFYYPEKNTASRTHFFENILLAQFLTDHYTRGEIEVHMAGNRFHPIDHYNNNLEKIMTRLKRVSFNKKSIFQGIQQETNPKLDQQNNQQTNQEDVEPNHQVMFGGANQDFDFLCFAPEIKAPDFLNQDLLLNARLIPVNRNTLQHQKYANVFALGDIANIEVEKSLSSISEQVSTVAQNLIDLLNDNPLTARYDGHTVFSMMTAKNMGYYWERNYSELNHNNFYLIQDNHNPSKQQKIALTSVTQAKYRLALLGFLV